MRTYPNTDPPLPGDIIRHSGSTTPTEDEMVCVSSVTKPLGDHEGEGIYTTTNKYHQAGTKNRFKYLTSDKRRGYFANGRATPEQCALAGIPYTEPVEAEWVSYLRRK